MMARADRQTDRRSLDSFIDPACSTHSRLTHTFNGPFSGTTQVSRYQKGKTNLDFTEARDSEWQWHQLGLCKYKQCHMTIQLIFSTAY